MHACICACIYMCFYLRTLTLEQSDSELIADMYHRISLSYLDSPELRITWLENLSALHAQVRCLL